MAYWLVKSEPEEYGWDHLVADGVGRWDGVRNLEARKHLRAMQPGDSVLVYHTGKAREIVGIAEVKRAAYPDPTSSEPTWSAVDLVARRALKTSVTLAQLKSLPEFADCLLVRRARLSVMPISEVHYQRILALVPQVR